MTDYLDFQAIFENAPSNFLVLKPNAPDFTILAVSNAYLAATKTKVDIIGKGLFEVFPDNPNDPNANGVKNLTASLNKVIELKSLNKMDVQKYDIPIPGKENGGFEVRYWSPENAPVLDINGEVVYIIHHVRDVTTEQELAKSVGGLENKVKDSDEQLLEKIKQLETMNNAMLGRETKMVELKEEIKELKEQLKNN